MHIYVGIWPVCSLGCCGGSVHIWFGMLWGFGQYFILGSSLVVGCLMALLVVDDPSGGKDGASTGFRR